ncbi:MAG: FkbM family methyltransferase [Candidatus Competibacter sp.]|nr:FkbM family methyltransferase [Candidatus Competibacter sp.]
MSKAGLNRIDFVKIDVQGYECKVLAGMQEVLKQYSPVVIFEYEAWAWAKADATVAYAADIFHAASYSLWRIVNRGEPSIKLLDITHSIPDHIDLLALKQDDPRLEFLLSSALIS